MYNLKYHVTSRFTNEELNIVNHLSYGHSSITRLKLHGENEDSSSSVIIKIRENYAFEISSDKRFNNCSSLRLIIQKRNTLCTLQT